ncbi:MAG: hypothetical protein JO000_29930, partial [Alphaproteobacteria bacterium]|nr:hypothetical protein [Alphaproteobacteria bacterium]
IGYHGGWGVGGAALHWFANVPRLLPNDFKIKSEHGRSLDWPISYDDVAPWYDRVAQEIGISGDAKAEELWRPAGQAYPMPPMKTFRNGEVWLKGFAANNIRMVPAAVAMNSVDFKGRPRLHLRRLVPCRLSDRRARQSAGHVSRRGARGRCRSAGVEHGDACPHRCARQEGNRRRIRRPGRPEARSAGERRRMRHLGGAESAALAQFGDRQASERSRQRERSRRQVHHDALHGRHERDV